jgi:Domain of unknown function (DUF5666)
MNAFKLSRIHGLVASLLLLLAALSSCGGGVGESGTGGFAGSSGFTSGPIVGFGSVIVNGVRFDDSAAQVLDGEGAARSRDDLRLGMTVEVDSSAITTDASGVATARASRIRYDSDLLGTVTAVDAASGAFTVLGQRVLIDGSTVFADTLGGLSALRAGQSVEVYAVYDAASQRYRATRVAAASGTAQPHVRGLVAQTDAGTQTLRIGDTSYAYGGASGLPASVAAGQYVRLTVSGGGSGGGGDRYAVQSFGTALPAVPDGDRCSFSGLVSSYVSSRSFSVNGRPVDAGNASISGGAVGVGVRVEVEGSLRNGVLQATRVQVSSEAQQSERLFELRGAITAVSAAQRSFTLRGLAVSTTRADLVYQSGNASALLVGRQVTVKGRLSADGLRIEATLIVFD